MLLAVLLPPDVLPPFVYKIPIYLFMSSMTHSAAAYTHYAAGRVPGSSCVQHSRRSPCLCPACCIQLQHTLIMLLPVWLLPVVKA